MKLSLLYFVVFGLALGFAQNGEDDFISLKR